MTRFLTVLDAAAETADKTGASSGTKVVVIIVGLLISAIAVLAVLLIAAMQTLKNISAKMATAEKDIDKDINEQVKLVVRFLEALKEYDKSSKPEELKRMYPKETMTMDLRYQILEQLAVATEHIRLKTEAFPEFAKEDGYKRLQIERYNIEEHLQNSVSQYNGFIKSFNREKSKFPGNIAANFLKLPEKPVFERNVQTADE